MRRRTGPQRAARRSCGRAGGARTPSRRRAGAAARSRLLAVATRVAVRADVRALRLPAVRRSIPRTHRSATVHRARARARRLAVAIALLSLPRKTSRNFIF